MSQIASDLNALEEAIIATATRFVMAMGIGPLVLAPFSEMFDVEESTLCRPRVLRCCRSRQALGPNEHTLTAMPTLTGFFESIGIANRGACGTVVKPDA